MKMSYSNPGRTDDIFRKFYKDEIYRTLGLKWQVFKTIFLSLPFLLDQTRKCFRVAFLPRARQQLKELYLQAVYHDENIKEICFFLRPATRGTQCGSLTAPGTSGHWCRVSPVFCSTGGQRNLTPPAEQSIRGGLALCRT